MTEFVCIGVPYYIGESIPERTEVEKIKQSGFAEEIGALWVDVVPDFATAPDPLTAVNRALAQAIKAHPTRVPLVFAGDCTCALGTLKGLARHDPAVIWYDAHGDFNTPETTPSGFLGGMPLAWLVGRGDMQYMRGVDLDPISESDVVITDARDLDPEEATALQQSHITHVPHVNDLLTTPLPHKPLYIHLDTDVVDPAHMPGMGYPAPGGPTVETVAETVVRVARDGAVTGILFSLWNDALAPDDRALNGTLALARAFASAR